MSSHYWCSGKSELLRTLVLGLIATHSPDELNLVLVDFKGGATFLGLDSHHVAAVITNLEAELELVDRMADALSGELHRRQELLRAAGNFANVTEYEKARLGGADLPPLPALVVVVDEFSELLAQKPDFVELFVAIGRLGRSLHIHLLLASQRLEEGRLRGLDSHLSYRIGLKTFSASESRTVLGVPDAYHLPSEPGAAYLKCDSATPIRFRTSYVSGVYRPPAAAVDSTAHTSGSVTVLRADTVVELPAVDETADEDVDGPSVLETLVGRIAGHGSDPHRVWLPPLESSVSVDDVPAVPHEMLTASIGVVDRPYDQRRDPLRVDLSRGAGHVAIVGGPQSGKSTALRTLICSLARGHSPRQTTFYCLDFGGGGLTALADLPHVGGVAPRNRRDAVRRTVSEVMGVRTAREITFADAGIDSMSAYRARCAAGDHPDDRYGDVFLVVDGYGVLRNEFEELDEQIADLVARGLSYGVHVVVTAGRWAEIRPAVKDLIGTRIELKLGDALDSEMDRRAAAKVPTGKPGRGITADGLHMLIALPSVVGVTGGEPAPAVRTLTTHLSPDDLTVPDGLSAGQVALGLAESDLEPYLVDFTREPHLLVFGDAECGKTATLRVLIDGIVATAGPAQAKVVLVDFRRSLLSAVDDDHLGGYASSLQTAGPMMAELAAHLAGRLPGDDVTTDQLRERSWWSGPDVYLVIDDYDLVATASGNPLAPLADLLGHARDIGLRVILARRSGGIGRALFDPFINRMRDLSCDVFMMAGDPDEGYIVGRHRMQRFGVGRGEYVSRSRQADTVQVVAPS
ncbi:type VII secretion protein EccCb [Gordonia malaquae]|uniref:type VII secretion protein EccCb n=1 Tax=Gordonia malaquae TaxID=410332 RepID=UPI003BF80133